MLAGLEKHEWLVVSLFVVLIFIFVIFGCFVDWLDRKYSCKDDNETIRK